MTIPEDTDQETGEWLGLLHYFTPTPVFLGGKKDFSSPRISCPQVLEGGWRLVTHLGVHEGYWFSFSVNLVLWRAGREFCFPDLPGTRGWFGSGWALCWFSPCRWFIWWWKLLCVWCCRPGSETCPGRTCSSPVGAEASVAIWPGSLLSEEPERWAVVWWGGGRKLPPAAPLGTPLTRDLKAFSLTSRWDWWDHFGKVRGEKGH